jgi:L-lactate utilization protein LutC
MAQQSQMSVQMVSVDGLADAIANFLVARGARRVACSGGGLLDRIDLAVALEPRSIEIRRWDRMTLDELYDFDAAVTEVTYAVAETGSLIIRATPQHGRALSLVPPVHVAVVQPKQILPDLVDLFEQLAREGADNTVIITGPSKTADIELTLVTGVHGPGVVHVFILQ